MMSVLRGVVLILICGGAFFISFASAADDSCYINDSGHMCCDKDLEKAMMGALGGGNLLAAADAIQRSAEGKLGGKFEAVVALDDFASKTHFKDGKTCKVEMNGKTAMAWQP